MFQILFQKVSSHLILASTDLLKLNTSSNRAHTENSTWIPLTQALRLARLCHTDSINKLFPSSSLEGMWYPEG